MVNQEL